jgi:hypothetical protein
MSVKVVTGYEITRQCREGDIHLDWKKEIKEAIQKASDLSRLNILYEYRVFPCYDGKQVASQGEENCFKIRAGVPIH